MRDYIIYIYIGYQQLRIESKFEKDNWLFFKNDLEISSLERNQNCFILKLLYHFLLKIVEDIVPGMDFGQMEML
jgi:hypothetical protein